MMILRTTAAAFAALLLSPFAALAHEIVVGETSVEIIRVSGKDAGACVVYDGDPVKLIERVIHVYRTSHVRKPSCFCDGPEGGG